MALISHMTMLTCETRFKPVSTGRRSQQLHCQSDPSKSSLNCHHFPREGCSTSNHTSPLAHGLIESKRSLPDFCVESFLNYRFLYYTDYIFTLNEMLHTDEGLGASRYVYCLIPIYTAYDPIRPLCQFMCSVSKYVH